MSSGKSRHGMWVIFGALLIQLSLGAIYAWSVFAKPLQVSGWSTSDTQWPFTVGLVAFALVMVYAGRKLYVFGPRKLTAAGGIMLGAGYLFAGAMGGESFWPTLIGVGLMGGAGIGLGYVVPIAVGMQWFPDKKGLITGVAVAGFGLGAMIWVKLAGTWGGLIADYGIGTTFMIYGGLFMVLVLIGSLWMSFPPEFVQPKPDHKGSKFDFRSEEMIRTTHYWSIFSTFAIGATAGLMCIGLMKQFPSQALTASGMAETLADATAGTAMVVFAIFNALGRIGWGRISDIIGHAVNCDHRGRKTSLIIMAASQGGVRYRISLCGRIRILALSVCRTHWFQFWRQFRAVSRPYHRHLRAQVLRPELRLCVSCLWLGWYGRSNARRLPGGHEQLPARFHYHRRLEPHRSSYHLHG